MRWERFQRQLVENWTGILGSLVLVAGVTFIGGYAGLRLSPLYRCGMIAGAAALLAGASVGVERRAIWATLALWLRSSAAAVFLFVTFASSAVPGLQWITTRGNALGALVLGLAVNLLVTAFARQQPIASLHVVLSLVPIVLVPQSPVALVLATLVSAVGAGLAAHKRWDLLGLITIAAYGVFHLAWYARVTDAGSDPSLRVLAASSALLVAGIVLLSHHRPAGVSSAPPVPLAARLIAWGVASAGLAIYSGARLRSAVLLGAGGLVLLLARVARARGSRWIHLTDTLVAEALGLAALVLLYPFVAHWLAIPALLFVYAGLCARIGVGANEPLLERVGGIGVRVAALALVVSGLRALGDREAGLQIQHALVLLTAALAGLTIHVALFRRRGEEFDALPRPDPPAKTSPISTLGCSLGVIAVVALLHLQGTPWMGLAALLAAVSIAAVARRTGSRGLEVATLLTLAGAHLVSWGWLIEHHPLDLSSQLGVYLPLALATGVAHRLAPGDRIGRSLRSAAIYLLGALSGLAVYTLLEPLSPLNPAVAWLALSLVALELADRLETDDARHVLLLGYGYLAASAAGYALVVLQTQQYLGLLPARMLVEVLGLSVAAYWWRYRPRERLARERSWRVAHPFFFELVLLATAVVVSVEVPAQWRPSVWIALALVGTAPPLGALLDSRIRFYALVLYWASTVDLAAVTSGLAEPGADVLRHPSVTGSVAIVGQVAFLVLAIGKLDLGAVGFPPQLSALGRWCRTIESRPALWVYYPFFAAIALFLYWRFASALLTLLWSLEAFTVFVLSLVLREAHFRYMALGALGVCLVRLLVVDMAQANLGLRGVIFVGVGLLMLAMNSIYSRYRDRFV